MATQSKLDLLKADLQGLKNDLARTIGGSGGQAVACQVEAYVGKALEVFVEGVMPAMLKPFLSGPVQSLGDELIADAQAATKTELQKVADSAGPGNT